MRPDELQPDDARPVLDFPDPRAAGIARGDAVAAAFAALDDLRRGVTLDMPLREAVEQGRD